MSFNDLERGTGGGGSSGGRPGYGAKNVGSSGAITSGPGSIRGSPSRGSLNNNNPSGAGGGSTLPLYHASGSSISPSTDDEDEEALTAEQLAELKRLSDGIGAQVFKVNSNTAAIEKLVKLAGEDAKKAGKGGGAQQQQGGNRDWTKRAHDLVESTRSVIKTTTPQLKQLSTLIVTYESRCPPQYRLTLSKLQRDFEGAVQGFAEAQRQSARRTKEDLEGAKRRAAAASASAASAGPSTSSPLVQIEDEQQQQQQRQDDDEGDASQQQLQSQAQQQSGPSAADLEFQEALIAERETEIREIESGIHELNEIFRDLGTIVQEQGGMIDNIEYNIGEIAVNTGDADRELVQAHDYQKRAGKRAACLLLVVGFVVAVVLVAVSMPGEEE